MIKGLFIYSDNMEDAESVFTRDLLLRGGMSIDTVTFGDSKLIETAYSTKIHADFLFCEVNVNDYDLLIIPGGKYVSEVIDNADDYIRTIKSFNKNKKCIAAICAAPAFLGLSGVLDNKKFTCYPSYEKYALKGIYKPLEKVVTEDNIITSRGAGTIMDFAYAIIEKLSDEKTAEEVMKSIMFY